MNFEKNKKNLQGAAACHIMIGNDNIRTFGGKKAYFNARHNCSAYVLGADGAKQKSNDDGEPGGTAGNPILDAIKKNGLTDIVVVVTRYFGGIKLGAGGLIRAYSHSAVLGLEAADIVEMLPLAVVRVTIGYDLLASVENYLRKKELRTGDKAYAEDVTVDVLLREEEKRTLRGRRDAGHGCARSSRFFVR